MDVLLGRLRAWLAAAPHRPIGAACLMALMLGTGNAGCATGPSAGPVPPPEQGVQVAIAPSPSWSNQGNVTTVILPSNKLTAMALDDQDRLYVAEAGTIHTFDTSAVGWPKRATDGKVVYEGTPWIPAIAVARDGSLWFLDTQHRIFRQAPGGLLQSWALPGKVSLPGSGLAVDSAGNAYVSLSRSDSRDPNEGNHYIARVTPDGVVTPFAGIGGTGSGLVDGQGAAARFSGPGALAFDDAGNLYVADRHNLAIRRVTPDGTVSTVAGRGRPSLPPPPMPGMPSPDPSPLFVGTIAADGLTLDAAGQLFYASTDNRIHRITPDGVQSVLAGDGKYCRGPLLCAGVCPTPDPDPCDRDGTSLTARFFRPSAIAVTRTGDMFVLDQETNGRGSRVRLIDQEPPR